MRRFSVANRSFLLRYPNLWGYPLGLLTIGQHLQGSGDANARQERWGRVSVGGATVEYRAYVTANGVINVGTYYPIR